MKIGQLYNLEAFQGFVDSGKKAGFTDAYSGVVLARNLEAIDPTLFEKKFPELSFVNSGIQADNSGGFVEQIRSLRVRPTGQFRATGDKSSGKGKISMAGETSFIQVLQREAESEWSETEVKQADLQNINLPSQYIKYHNEIYLREVDEIGFLGYTDYGTEGLLNYSGFTTVAATGAIAGLSAQQAYDDMAGLIITQWNVVNNTPEYMATRVVMPIYAMNELQTKILNTANGSNITVLNMLIANFPTVTFSATFRADDAGGVGVSHTCAFNPNVEAMKMRIPEALTIGEIIKVSSFKHLVESRYRVAGLDVLEDTAGYILTGW